jgi:hypothetical protein
MFASGQKATGTEYTTTVAFLVVAFLFSPAILLFFRPLGYLSVSLAVGCSALCVALAWVNWKKASQLTIPSIEDQGAK